VRVFEVRDPDVLITPTPILRVPPAIPNAPLPPTTLAVGVFRILAAPGDLHVTSIPAL
jgi:hypothetical protein